MNSLDYVLFAIIAVAALRCWFRGIIGEILSTAALVGGLLAGIFFYRPIGAWISNLVALGGLEPFAGFVAAFAIVFIVVKVIERSLRSVLENLNLDFLDRILGLVFGALEGIIISAIILLVLRYQPLVNVGALLEGSFVARILLPIIAERFPDSVKNALIIAAMRKA
jgi:membrane protein required for colicin V production